MKEFKETLTKENFWNEIRNKYPEAMKLFLNWIDQYKKDNDWYSLFNGREGWDCRALETELHPPKYHELPTALQFGIFMEFTHWYSVKYESEDSIFIEESKEIITETLKGINEEL